MNKSNENVKPLLEALDHHLVLASMLAGCSAGTVYVDNTAAPRSVFAGYKGRLFLAGEPGDADFNTRVARYLQEEYFPHANAQDRHWFTLEVDPPAWSGVLEAVLGETPPQYPRTYLECKQLVEDWRPLLPAGFDLRPVDASLLSETGLENMDDLREELCSERNSVAEFIEKSFGFCLVKDGCLASWCLSEYNTGDRCEVGVATVEKFQRQGLATVTTLALVEHALSHGYQRVGWHSWKNNVPSVELARRCGFELVTAYEVFVLER